MTERLTLTLRDMYMSGTDTVELSGKALKAYQQAVDKSAFLARLETVEFKSPYVTSSK